MDELLLVPELLGYVFSLPKHFRLLCSVHLLKPWRGTIEFSASNLGKTQICENAYMIIF